MARRSQQSAAPVEKGARRGGRMDAAWLSRKVCWVFLERVFQDSRKLQSICHQSYTQDDAASGHSGHVLSYLGGLSGSDEEAANGEGKLPEPR